MIEPYRDQAVVCCGRSGHLISIHFVTQSACPPLSFTELKCYPRSGLRGAVSPFLNDLVQYTPGDTRAEDRFPSANSADGFNDLCRLGFSFTRCPTAPSDHSRESRRSVSAYLLAAEHPPESFFALHQVRDTTLSLAFKLNPLYSTPSPLSTWVIGESSYRLRWHVSSHEALRVIGEPRLTRLSLREK
jgi:hypothetical protein